jgi:anti-anti-sigma factor
VRTRTAFIRRNGGAADDGTACEPPFVDEREVAYIAPSSCRVVAEPDQDAAVFRLQGELDATTAGEVSVLLAAAVGEHSVVLDLTEVSLIDAAGLGALRDAMRCIHERGGLVALVRPWRSAASILELVGSVGFAFVALSSAGALRWLSDPENRPRNRVERGEEFLKSYGSR